jgi:hypothetical protein
MTNPYIEEGYKNRADYLHGLADNMGIDFSTVAALANVLGENEDFDGLVTELEDLLDMGDIDSPWY